MHSTVTRTLVALGFVGAMAVGTAAPTLAQGIYFNGPGVSVGIGDRGYYGHRRHYRSDRYYSYYDRDDRPYWRHRGYRTYDRW